MTFEKILNDLNANIINAQTAYNEISSSDKIKRINFYSHIKNISEEPLKENQLQELHAIVGILQILYNSDVGSPISDSNYDSLQEMLIDMGIPRLSGSLEINSANKVEHTYKNMRGTLDKVYYLYPDEYRTNKSRKSLDDWIKRISAIYEKNTSKQIDWNNVKVLCQPKMDGCSCVLEVTDGKPLWITRGDTRNNKASDISHIMNIFNKSWVTEGNYAVKFEVMMTEENWKRINDLYRDHRYKNSRQIVTATLNANEADFKAEYLYPVPLRLTHKGDTIEQIHPSLIENFPTVICTLGDRDIIKNFANNNKFISINNMRMRTDGAVLTIIDPEIQKNLGRDNDINNFEVAYKFTEESAYTKVKDIEFYVSEFGYITPVLVVNDVILKGNTINHISLSNKERFDELNLSYGDEVKVLYDIIPYAVIDEKCKRVPYGRKIEFTHVCPKCHEPLNLDQIQVQCTNNNCPSRIIGNIMNYCATLRIQNIGYKTLEVLYAVGLLDNGIRSLYKLKKKSWDIENLEGFGKLKTKKIISEIEAKRRLKDYEFFGAIGIEGLSTKTFQMIFNNINLKEFLNMIKVKNFNLLTAKLIQINGIGDSKASMLIDYLKNSKNYKELLKLFNEVTLYSTYGNNKTSKGKVIFSGCRPNSEISELLINAGYEPSDSWNNSAKCLIVPNSNFESSKTEKARSKNIPIIAIDSNNPLTIIKNVLNI